MMDNCNWLCRCLQALFVGLIALLLAGLLCFFIDSRIKVELATNEFTVDLKEKVLCPAKAESITVFEDQEAILELPDNIAITKIYASIRDFNAMLPANNANLTVSDSTGIPVNVNFKVDPADVATLYETTLVQPLCVERDVKVEVSTLSDNVFVEVQALRLTVVYCTDYCDGAAQ